MRVLIGLASCAVLMVIIVLAYGGGTCVEICNR